MTCAVVALLPRQERELQDLVFAVQRSIRYHNHRRRFFDRFDRWSKVLSLVTGSAAFATAVGAHHSVTVALAGLVAIISAVDLVVGPAQAARLHTQLANRFAEHERKIRLATPLDVVELNALVAERLLIEADEPPPLRVLDTICHNELCRALGHDDCEFYDVGRLQLLFADFIDLWPWRIQKRTGANADSRLG